MAPSAQNSLATAGAQQISQQSEPLIETFRRENLRALATHYNKLSRGLGFRQWPYDNAVVTHFDKLPTWTCDIIVDVGDAADKPAGGDDERHCHEGQRR